MIEVGTPESLQGALRPWTRRLMLESLREWAIRGAIAALAVAVAVLAVGWMQPIPEAELRPLALRIALPLVVVGALVGLWPRSTLRRAWQLDARLAFSDRLTTAWLQRAADDSMASLQRGDTLRRLSARSLERDLPLRWQRGELIALGTIALVGAALVLVPSPMQSVLDQQAAEAAAVQAAAQQLDALRQAIAADETLSPDQVQKLDELLQQAHSDLSRAKSEQDAQSVLANTAQQVSQLGDPSADAREEALGAMSETLSQEPLTRSLGDALARNDPAAAAKATQDLAAQADQLSDVQRSALSRALQRAANVGRGEPRSSSALRDAAQALSSGNSSSEALNASSQALQQALQSVTAQATLRSANQRLQDLRAALGNGMRPGEDVPLPGSSSLPSNGGAGLASEPGKPVPIDANPAAAAVPQGQSGAGYGAVGVGDQASGSNAPEAAENVFVPGVLNEGPGSQDLVQQPFSVRGAPRPYREVLSQYAQAGRDYVDRADVAPDVRDLVKQYFSKLEEGQ